jgi:hypothetical protein
MDFTVGIGPVDNGQSGGVGSQKQAVLLENLNASYSSEKNQALQLLGVAALIMGAGALTGKTGIFVVGFIVALFGWARYQGAMDILAQRDATSTQFVLGAEVKV